MFQIIFLGFLVLILDFLGHGHTNQPPQSVWMPRWYPKLNSSAYSFCQLNNELEIDELNHLNDLLQNGNNKMSSFAETDEAIVLMGNTGSGKTSLGLYITAIENLYAYRPTRTGPLVLIDKDEKIGIGMVTSTTEMPDLFKDTQTSTVIYDCPGFSDTRSPIQDIAGTYFTKRVISSAKAVKFILVINQNSVEMAGNKLDLTQLATHAANVIKKMDKFKDAIGLVVTKVQNSQIPDKDYIEDIAYFLRSTKEELESQNDSASTKTISLIDILLQQNSDGYSRIGIMRSPSQSGIVSQDPVLINGQKPLRNMLLKNLQYVSHSEDDFGLTISAESNLYVNWLKLKIKYKLKSVIEKIAQKISDYLNDIEQKVTDLKDLKNIIHLANKVLSKLKYSKDMKNYKISTFVAENIKDINTTIDISYIEHLKEAEDFLEFLESVSSLVMDDIFDEFSKTELTFENSEKYYNFIINLEETIARMESKADHIRPLIANLYELSDISIRNSLDTIGIDLFFKENKNIQHIYNEIKHLNLNNIKLQHFRTLIENKLHFILQIHSDKTLKSINSMIHKISYQILLYFHDLEDKTTDFQYIKEKMHLGLQIISEITGKNIYIDNFSQCIIQIRDDLKVSIDNSDVNVLQEETNFLCFLRRKSNEEETLSTEFTEFKDIYNYFQYSENYYQFLIELESYFKYNDITLQFDKISELANRNINEGTSLDELDLDNVFQIKLYAYFFTYDYIKHTRMSKENIIRLSYLLKDQLKSLDNTN